MSIGGGEQMRFVVYPVLLVLLVILSSANAMAQDSSDEPYSEVFPVYEPSGVEYDPDILEAFENASEVRITVKVRDTTGIVVRREDSKDVQGGKDLERKRLLDNKVDVILAGLSDSEFNLMGRFITGHGFYGNVTRDGFNKLLNNPNVGKVYLSGVSYVQGGLGTYSDLSKAELMVEDVQEDEVIDVSDSNLDVVEDVQNDSAPEDVVEEVEEKKSISLFSRIVQFFKSLLKL